MSKQVEKARGDRKAFCDYLRAGREARELSLDEIARITRIPERSLQHLESGDFESLPADVFVRGFLRSYAQVVGLDPDDALRRYAHCGLAPSPVSQHGARASSQSGALARGSQRSKPAALAAPPPVEAELEAAPVVAEVEAAPVVAEVEVAPVAPEPIPEPVVEAEVDDAPAVDAAAPATESKKKKRRRRRNKKKKPAAIEASAPEVDRVSDEVAPVDAEVAPVDAAPPAGAATVTVVTPPRPTLVIDDEDPSDAEAAQAARIDAEADERELARRSFLPSILLESEEGSRRGALTLAVIILVIVATLTMSYLLRHPSSSGSGVTELDTHGATRA